MYRLEIYDKTGENIIVAVREYVGLKIDFKIGEPSQLSFYLINGSNVATPSNLKKKNQVVLKKDGDVFWQGFISNVIPTETTVEIVCLDLLEKFAGRVITGKFEGNLGEVVKKIYEACNAKGNLYIKNVDVNSSKTGSFEFKNRNALECIKEVCNAGCEILVFKQTLMLRDNIGTKQELLLFFDEYYTQNNNIDEPSIEELGKEIKNKIYATGKGELISTKEDAESIAEYGLEEDYVVYDSAYDQATLDKMTQEYLDKHKQPQINVKFLLIVKEQGEFDNLFLGDNVKIHIKKGYNDIRKTMRVVGISYDVSQKSSMPGISIELSEGNEVSKDIFADIKNMRKRIIELENK